VGRVALSVPFATAKLRRRINKLTCSERISGRQNDVQARVESARKRRAWLGKAGLGHGVVLGMVCKHDGVSHSGGLKDGDCQHDDEYND